MHFDPLRWISDPMARPPKTPLIDFPSLSFEITALFEGGPVVEEELFAGRATEVRRMLEAVLDRSKHVVLYGERGVGKTSIANVFWKRYNKQLKTVIAARAQVYPSDDFSAIWIRALEEFKHVSQAIGKDHLVPIDTDYSIVTPDTIRREMQKCKPNAIPIIIIDEYDKLKSAEARELTANVIKSFYDYSVNATIILVGVAEDISDLVVDHGSIRRTLSQIKLDRMKTYELHEIINKRLTLLPIKFSSDAQWTIVLLARGLPYYVLALSKFALQNAAENERIEAGLEDVWVALDKLVLDEEHSFDDAYALATSSPQVDNQFKQVLVACALADGQDSGFFSPRNVLPKLMKITGKTRTYAHFQRHLNEFITSERGNVLTRKGDERSFTYKFTDPMMQPYVVIRSIRDGIIDKDMRSILTFPEQAEMFPSAQ